MSKDGKRFSLRNLEQLLGERWEERLKEKMDTESIWANVPPDPPNLSCSAFRFGNRAVKEAAIERFCQAFDEILAKLGDRYEDLYEVITHPEEEDLLCSKELAKLVKVIDNILNDAKNPREVGAEGDKGCGLDVRDAVTQVTPTLELEGRVKGYNYEIKLPQTIKDKLLKGRIPLEPNTISFDFKNFQEKNTVKEHRSRGFPVPKSNQPRVVSPPKKGSIDPRKGPFQIGTIPRAKSNLPNIPQKIIAKPPNDGDQDDKKGISNTDVESATTPDSEVGSPAVSEIDSELAAYDGIPVDTSSETLSRYSYVGAALPKLEFDHEDTCLSKPGDPSPPPRLLYCGKGDWHDPALDDLPPLSPRSSLNSSNSLVALLTHPDYDPNWYVHHTRRTLVEEVPAWGLGRKNYMEMTLPRPRPWYEQPRRAVTAKEPAQCYLISAPSRVDTVPLRLPTQVLSADSLDQYIFKKTERPLPESVMQIYSTKPDWALASRTPTPVPIRDVLILLDVPLEVMNDPGFYSHHPKDYVGVIAARTSSNIWSDSSSSAGSYDTINSDNISAFEAMVTGQLQKQRVPRPTAARHRPGQCVRREKHASTGDLTSRGHDAGRSDSAKAPVRSADDRPPAPQCSSVSDSSISSGSASTPTSSDITCKSALKHQPSPPEHQPAPPIIHQPAPPRRPRPAAGVRRRVKPSVVWSDSDQDASCHELDLDRLSELETDNKGEEDADALLANRFLIVGEEMYRLHQAQENSQPFISETCVKKPVGKHGLGAVSFDMCHHRRPMIAPRKPLRSDREPSSRRRADTMADLKVEGTSASTVNVLADARKCPRPPPTPPPYRGSSPKEATKPREFKLQTTARMRMRKESRDEQIRKQKELEKKRFITHMDEGVEGSGVTRSEHAVTTGAMATVKNPPVVTQNAFQRRPLLGNGKRQPMRACSINKGPHAQ